jgi:hypothetical protein
MADDKPQRKPARRARAARPATPSRARAREKPQPNPDSWRPAFLEALSNTDNVRAACTASGVSRGAAYRARNNSEDFRLAWAVAKEDAGDALLAQARKLAVLGWDEPVWGTETYFDQASGKVLSRTVQVGSVHKWDTRLLQFLLAAAKPDEFARRVHVTTEMLEKIRDEKREAVRRLRAVAGGAGATAS